MSVDKAARAAAILDGDVFLTCKGCGLWRPQYGNRQTATIGWCMKAAFSDAEAPDGYMTRCVPVQMNGVVNGSVTLIYNNASTIMEHPVTTDLQCCSAWEQAT